MSTVASAEPVPSALKTASPRLSELTRRLSPTIPLTLIITAAKTVSRASVDASLLPVTISVTISATSMTVTATARIREPNGSPTRWATTSAWWTAASTAATSTMATSASTTPGGCVVQVATSTRAARGGAAVVQAGRLMGKTLGAAGEPTDREQHVTGPGGQEQPAPPKRDGL